MVRVSVDVEAESMFGTLLMGFGGGSMFPRRMGQVTRMWALGRTYSGDMLLDLKGLKGRVGPNMLPLVVVLECGISVSVVHNKSQVTASRRTVASRRQQVQQVTTWGKASEHRARATWVDMLLCAHWEATDLFLSLRSSP